jgi:MoaA/NifB/PqqE/SkfB family radical SAM enzyme
MSTMVMLPPNNPVFAGGAWWRLLASALVRVRAGSLFILVGCEAARAGEIAPLVKSRVIAAAIGVCHRDSDVCRRRKAGFGDILRQKELSGDTRGEMWGRHVRRRSSDAPPRVNVSTGFLDAGLIFFKSGSKYLTVHTKVRKIGGRQFDRRHWAKGTTMQSKIAHAAERKAFSIAIDHAIKGVRSDHPEEAINKFLDMGGKLLADTAPDMANSLRKAFYPGSKWENFLIELVRDRVDPNILKTAVLNGAYESAFRGLRETTQSAEKYQCNVPWIIIFDPTSACNKHCIGCWAADYGNSLNLSFDDMDRLVTEAKALGTHFFMMTGGEPLVRKKDVVRLAEKHDDCIFGLFTNGSLIDQKLCDDCKRLGNIVFSMSLEGFKTANDGRRGDGSFDEVVRAMDLMTENGVPFGISTCYTRNNVEDVTSDEYYDFIIEHGALWQWYFHYMPVGEGANADLMPTIEQREYMIDRIRKIRDYEGGKAIMAMDFQNDGEFVGGCIAGGRVFCHVNARGDVEPCVFIHYSNANIHEKSWLECLQQPIFQEYRANWPWNDNMLRPCPMLENPQVLPEMVHDADAKSTEYTSPEDVDHLCARTAKYAEKWAPEGDRIWVEEHPTGKKVYEDNISMMDVDKKAKMLAEKDAELNSQIEDELKEEKKEAVGAAK